MSAQTGLQTTHNSKNVPVKLLLSLTQVKVAKRSHPIHVKVTTKDTRSSLKGGPLRSNLAVNRGEFTQLFLLQYRLQ